MVFKFIKVKADFPKSDQLFIVGFFCSLALEPTRVLGHRLGEI